MKDAITLLDVANAARVSKATVSNVFSRPERVRPELRARVEAIALELGYTGPDPRGRMLSSGKVNAIGVVPPAESGFSWVFADPYMCEFLAGVAQICEQHDASLSLIAARDQHGGLGIRVAVVDGFILGSIEQAEFIEPSMRRKLPFVVMDVDGSADISSVRIDDRGGARQLAGHLLALGHRKFAICSVSRRTMAPVVHLPNGGPRELVAAYPSDRERLAGIAEALAEAGLSIDDVPIVEACGTEEEKWLYGGGGASLVLDNAPDATAIITLSGPLTLAVLAEAQRRGISVPGRLSIAGFDTPPEVAHTTPPLTTIAQPVAEKGRAAARILFEPGPVQHLVLPVELQIRASTAPPPKARRHR